MLSLWLVGGDVIVCGNFSFCYSRHDNQMAAFRWWQRQIVVNIFRSVWWSALVWQVYSGVWHRVVVCLQISLWSFLSHLNTWLVLLCVASLAIFVSNIASVVLSSTSDCIFSTSVFVSVCVCVTVSKVALIFTKHVSLWISFDFHETC